MKRLLILALLAGCAASGQVASTTPTPEIVETPQTESANPYAGALDFLGKLLDLDAAGFEKVCAMSEMDFSTTQDYYVCSNGFSGFSIQIVDGVTKGSSLLVPASEGETLARALIAEVGEPDFTQGFTAAWALDGFILVFAPVGDAAFILVLEIDGPTI